MALYVPFPLTRSKTFTVSGHKWICVPSLVRLGCFCTHGKMLFGVEKFPKMERVEKVESYNKTADIGYVTMVVLVVLLVVAF